MDTPNGYPSRHSLAVMHEEQDGMRMARRPEYGGSSSGDRYADQLPTTDPIQSFSQDDFPRPYASYKPFRISGVSDPGGSFVVHGELSVFENGPPTSYMQYYQERFPVRRKILSESQTVLKGNRRKYLEELERRHVNSTRS